MPRDYYYTHLKLTSVRPVARIVKISSMYLNHVLSLAASINYGRERLHFYFLLMSHLKTSSAVGSQSQAPLSLPCLDTESD